MLIGHGYITSCLIGYQRPEVVLSAMWKAHCPIRPMQRQSTRNSRLCGYKRGQEPRRLRAGLVTAHPPGFLHLEASMGCEGAAPALRALANELNQVSHCQL